MTNGAGIGANIKYTYGLSSLSNLQGIIGTGGGPRRFRLGAAMTFDFFPDLEGQPGIGIAAQMIYYRLPNSSQLETTAIPYIHKAYDNDGNVIDPFVAVPIGLGFSDGKYSVLATLAIGASLHQSESVKYIGEIGIAINRSESYISGGISFNL
jgi:hypothetical protein